jgi:hypothetical protein
MEGAMTKTVAIAILLLSSFGANAQRRRTPPAPPTRSTDSPIRDLAILTGQCRFQLVRGFFRCDDKVVLAQLANDRSVITFIKGNIQFHLSGGHDRQPNLENYYLAIDTVAITNPGEQDAEDRGMEGECHFRMNKTGNKFFFVKCDISNRSKGSMYNFYLENIRTTKHRAL